MMLEELAAERELAAARQAEQEAALEAGASWDALRAALTARTGVDVQAWLEEEAAGRRREGGSTRRAASSKAATPACRINS